MAVSKIPSSIRYGTVIAGSYYTIEHQTLIKNENIASLSLEIKAVGISGLVFTNVASLPQGFIPKEATACPCTILDGNASVVYIGHCTISQEGKISIYTQSSTPANYYFEINCTFEV